MESMIGKSLGQYQLVDQIGKGGMATVYKAYQPSLNRYVAIKVLPPYYLHEPGFVERFTREARAIAQLDHPNILPVYDFGRQDDISYIVMKYVPAGTLHDKLDRAMSPAQALEIIEQVAGALDNAHQQGILHRDIKPSNILIDERGWSYLSDFGLAKMVEGSVQLTGSGVGVGTPAYMSPEQGQGLPVDARTDIYALGVVLFEMLTGQVPYEAETPMAVVIKHITDPIPMPRQMNPNIPEPVERVLLKALAKNPEDRFARAGQMAVALRQAVEGLEPTVAGAPILPDPDATFASPPRQVRQSPPVVGTAPPPSSPPAAPAAPKRFPWLPVLLGLTALVAAGGCALAGLFYFSGGGGFSTPTPFSSQSAGLTTSSPTPVSATATPTPIPPVVATDSLLPTQTPAPQPTDTLVPTDPPLPTETPLPTSTAIPTSPPQPTATDTPTPIPTPTFTPSPTSPPRWTDTGLRPGGRFAEIWNALGAGESDLGYPLTANPVGDRLCARQYFDRGYMIWFDSPQDPDPVWAVVIPDPTAGSGNKLYKFTDSWPGSPDYWCPEAEANAPLGPRRGFGMLWCEYPNMRADIGQAREEEIGGPAYPSCQAQPFQGGTIVHNPLDAKFWVFIDNGGWYRFDE